ncbi:MAG: hypothetical protein HWN65_24340 [Candidatus Helarchaeota archaeon]|nr:hypothetical protein [Candidatus Helarchaeota archaeon]
MKIVVETSVLIGTCVFWKRKDLLVKHHFFDKCNKLFEFLRDNPELGIVTKTIENEAKNVLDKAVNSTIRHTYFPDIGTKIRVMTLQHIISNHCLDKLENLVEECSTRLPINTKKRDKIKNEEIEPFLNEIVKTTVRYIQPKMPSFLRGKRLRGELTDIMVRSLPKKGIIYKGMPADRDLTIMSEATMIYRKYEGKEKVYVASTDNHFIPNRVQIGSFLSGHMKKLDELDSSVRDKLAKKFGFIGDDPLKILEHAEKEKVSIGKVKVKKERRKILVPKQIAKKARELEGTLEAVLLNKKMEQIERLPVSALTEKLQGIKDVNTVIFDGVITQRLVDLAAERNIKYLVAARVSEAIKQPLQVNLLTFTEIED